MSLLKLDILTIFLFNNHKCNQVHKSVLINFYVFISQDEFYELLSSKQISEVQAEPTCKKNQGVSDDTVDDAGNMSQSTLDVEPSVEENPQDSTIVDDLEASLYMTGGLVPYGASSDSSDTIEYSPCTPPTSLLDAHQSNEDIMAEWKENKPRTSLTRKGISMKCKLKIQAQKREKTEI